MSKLRLVAIAFVLAFTGAHVPLSAQVIRCGQEVTNAAMAKENPAMYRKMRDEHREMIASFGPQDAELAAKGAAANPIPVVFHFVLTQGQLNALGGNTELRRRVLSQIQVLNADYNRGNADSTRIPAAFKPFYGRVGMRFGLTGTTSANTIYPGIELKIVPEGTIFAVDNHCYAAKQGTNGLPQWDKTKYLNVWICKITTSGGAGEILGVATPQDIVGYSSGSHVFSAKEVGVAINWQYFGKKEDNSQYFGQNAPFYLGRTLTHELGHFFGLAHTWGDDDYDGTIRCPNDPNGEDDYINDTPPQGQRTYCDKGFTQNLCPTFPLLDKCAPNSPGVMFMNYMDYGDDSVMLMFTAGQATTMNSFLAANYPTLDKNPQLLSIDNDFNVLLGNVSVSPNPASGMLHLNIERSEGFRGAAVINMMGQTVSHIAPAPGRKQYEIDLSAAPRGIYMVHCYSDNGTITRKIVLQ